MDKKLIGSRSRWPYFHNPVKITSETLCRNWKRQCANGESLQVRQRSICDIKKSNVIEITICVHTINGIIRTKNSTRL